MKKSCRFVQILGAVALIGLFLVGNADADTRLIYSGVACQPNYGSQVSGFSYYSTAMTNNASATRGVTCPVVRHNPTNTNGIIYARVYVVGTGTFEGYFDNVTNCGGLGYWDSDSITLDDSCGYLYFTLSKTLGSTPYAVLLYLPEGGKVTSYDVMED